LNTAFKEPKITPFYLLKIPPLIRTASKCIERAGDSKEESPISSLLGSDYGAILNTTFEEPKNPPFWFLKIETYPVPGFTKPNKHGDCFENLSIFFKKDFPKFIKPGSLPRGRAKNSLNNQ